jgi:leader peptidase (prepilin peptidase)/N-methyltransferase
MSELAISTFGILFGAVAGTMMEKSSNYLIEKRVNSLRKYLFPEKIKSILFWSFLNSSIWFLMIQLNGLNSQTLEYMMLASVSIVISAVDITIKKIPNELILMTLFIAGAFLVTGQSTSNILLNMLGFIIGFVIFTLPAFIGKGAGWGDVKYAAAVGFCLGIYGLMTAIIIMAFFLTFYTMFIIISGRGSLKSKVPLGPFITSGFVSVMILNLLKINYFPF